jgi:hypothetical protein
VGIALTTIGTIPFTFAYSFAWAIALTVIAAVPAVLLPGGRALE